VPGPVEKLGPVVNTDDPQRQTDCDVFGDDWLLLYPAGTNLHNNKNIRAGAWRWRVSASAVSWDWRPAPTAMRGCSPSHLF
jgi:hypothetical protein